MHCCCVIWYPRPRIRFGLAARHGEMRNILRGISSTTTRHQNVSAAEDDRGDDFLIKSGSGHPGGVLLDRPLRRYFLAIAPELHRRRPGDVAMAELRVLGAAEGK